MTLRVVTANVNGIRAALRRGGLEWLAGCGADVLSLQEVRATPEQVAEALGAGRLGEWHLALADGARAGHAGVTLLSRLPLEDVSVGIGGPEFAEQGRWVEATIADPAGAPDRAGPADPRAPEGPRHTQVPASPGAPADLHEQAAPGDRPRIRIASVYVHTGEPEGPRAHEKDRFLTAMGEWLADHADEQAIVCGDLNVAHRPDDIKNWRGNRGRAGFLESERAHLDRWYRAAPDGLGWTDLGRRFGGDGPGPFTWWSWRGRGFDTDGGWRIDAVLASRAMADRATGVTVHKAASYSQRWSDHAAVTATFN